MKKFKSQIAKFKFWKKRPAKPETKRGKYSWTTEDGREVSARMQPLSFKRQIRAAAAIRDLGLGDLQDVITGGVNVRDLIESLQKFDVLEDLLDAVLIREDGCEKQDLLDMPYPVERQVVEDFLALNPGLLRDCGNLLMIRVLKQRKAMGTRPTSRVSA